MSNYFKGFKIKLASTVLMVSLLSGCAEGQYSKQNAGTVVGAGLGAITAGSQFGKGEGRIVAAVAGSMLGGYIGNKSWTIT